MLSLVHFSSSLLINKYIKSKTNKQKPKVFTKHNIFFQILRRSDSLSSARCRCCSQAACLPCSSCSCIPRRHLADIFHFSGVLPEAPQYNCLSKFPSPASGWVGCVARECLSGRCCSDSNSRRSRRSGERRSSGLTSLITPSPGLARPGPVWGRSCRTRHHLHPQSRKSSVWWRKVRPWQWCSRILTTSCCWRWEQSAPDPPQNAQQDSAVVLFFFNGNILAADRERWRTFGESVGDRH